MKAKESLWGESKRWQQAAGKRISSGATGVLGMGKGVAHNFLMWP
jgi:hypothetical protein